MRRQNQNPGYGYSNGGTAGNYTQQMIDEENDQMVDTLSTKVKALKSLTIDIGQEVQYQNKMLNNMDGEFDSAGSFLSGTMGRLNNLVKKGHHNVMCYLLLFCFFVIFITWVIIRWR